MAKLDFGSNPTSVVIRVKLLDSSVTTGAGLTGLTCTSVGLIIGTIKIGEAVATAYTQAGATIETITTLGTYETPTATKCRFKEVDATNHPGMYEIHITDARYASTNNLIVSVHGATNLAQFDTEVQCTDIASNLVDAVWDEVLTGATHNIATSAGRRVREIGAYAIHSGTAQDGNSIHLTLAATASADDGVYNRNLLVIVEGAGAGQTRTIVDYDGATKIALADREWRVTPDATSEYQITPDDTPLVADHGVGQAGTANTITLRSYASSVDDVYSGGIITIIAGTGRGESQIVDSYNGSTKVATMCTNWTVTPDTTSVYVVMPYGMSAVACVGDGALTSIRGEMESDGTKLALVKDKTDNLPSGIAKNIALSNFNVFMVLSTDHTTGAVGKTISCKISKDGGSFGTSANAVAEISGGMYKIDLTQTEMNADTVTLLFTNDDCDDRVITIYTS